MSRNADVSGKKRRLRDQEKEREAAMAKAATPSTPPQDEPEPSPQPEPEKPAPTEISTPEPAKETETVDKAEAQQSALEIDYKTQYRQLNSKYEKLQASHNTLKGKYNKAEQEKKDLQKQMEGSPTPGAPDPVSGVRETEAFKRLTSEWGEQDAEDILEIARSLAGQNNQQTTAPEDDSSEPESFEDPFFLMMDERLPGWDLKYNSSPGFVTWAKSNFEPFSGSSYMSLLKKAQDEVDPDTAIRIFSAFDRSQVNQTPDISPEDYVEPSNEGGGGAQTTPEAPTFEQGYLDEQQELLRKNKISRADFYKRREEFLAAYKEGRVKAA